MLAKRSALLCAGILGLIWLSGCGGSSAPPASVTVTASASSVDGADTVTLTAKVTNDTNAAGVKWSLSGDGTLSNTSTTSATYTAPAATSSAQTATVTATSVADPTKSGSATITIPAKPSVTTSASALDSSVGSAFSVTLQASGGISPYTWTVSNGSLPSCLTLNKSTGAITGTVTASCAGTYDITFTVTDSGTPNPLTATAQLNFTIAAAPAITLPATLTPATATAGLAYTGSVAATGGAGALTYSISAGSLPAGLSLNASTGAITGTPTTSGPATFTVKAADNFGDTPATQAYTLNVSAGAATHLALAVKSSTTVTAGGTVSFTVTALDVDGNTATSYSGTIKFTSSDAQAVLPSNSTLASGVGSFQATLKTAGSQTIAATDTTTASITGVTGAITVNAAAVSKLAVSAPSTATAGTAINVTVTAEDAYGNTATSYAGTVAFTSTDSAAVLPSNSALASGTKSFQVTLKTAGSKAVTATDTVTTSITGTSGAITVIAAAASKLVVSAPATASAGAAITVSVTAQDPYGNTATGYAGTVHFTSTDAAATLPANSTLTSGAGSFQATLKTAGSQTITATDTATSSITGSTGAITVSAAAVSKLAVSAPSTATAGTAINVTVTAEDAYGNTITNYSGIVAITSSDTNAVLPANSALTNGVKVFSVTLKTAGSKTVTATDTITPSITGTSGAITVSAAAASKLVISAPATATAGTAITVSVTAQDQYGNTATGYTGTVHFTSTDAAAALPANSTLTSGVGSFQATLKTAGSQTITATDTVTSSLTATTGTVTVSPASATQLLVSAPSSATAGTAISISVTAKDAYGNTVTSYSGTVHFTSTDAAAALPSNSTLASGVGSFSATLKTAGSQTITATDTVTSSLAGTTGAITVSPAAVSKLLVSAPANATNNVAFNFAVTAQDAYGNTVTSFADTVAFTSTDGAAVLPGASTLVNGTKSFSATLKTNGSQTITATDTSNGAIKGTSGAINVSTALIINTTTLPPGNVGISYSQTLTASGGTGTGYTWSATSSNLSSYSLALTTSGSNGLVSGTPSQSGTASFTANVKDSAGNTATQALTIQVYAGLTLPASNSLPTGYIGETYPGTIVGTGGSNNLSIAITSALSPVNGTLAANLSGATVSFIGTPTTATTESISVKLTDNTTGNSISQTYSFTISTPTYSLPTTNPPAATVGQAYSQTITANVTGGSGNYAWLINGTEIPSNGTPTALGASGLAAEFYASDTGGTTLTLATASGTPPSTTGSVPFNAEIYDNTTNQNSNTQSYTITVNPSGGSISGVVYLNNLCVSGSLPFTFTVTATPSSGSPTQISTDDFGSYSFQNLPFGTYTVSVAPVSGAESTIALPASYNVTLSSTNSTITGENFNASVGFTVSGTVSYPGSQTGQTYLYLQNNNCGGNQGNPGTSISAAALTSGGAYTIHNISPGSYTLYAWMDSTGISSGTDYPGGQGELNTNDPTGSNSSVQVTSGDVTGANVSLSNATYATPPSNPSFHVIPVNGGWLLSYTPPTVNLTNGNQVEAANEYALQWAVSNGTDSDGATCSLGSGGQFSTVAGSHTFYATGTSQDVWIVNNTSMGAGTFTAGQSYCFQARAFNTLASTTHPSGWATYTDSDGNAEAVAANSSTSFCTTNCTTVSGAVTIPSGVNIASGAPLYVGYFQQNSSGKGPSAIYATEITSPVSGGSGNSYQLTIPNGSGYVLFGILDQNNDGMIDAYDVTDVRHNNKSGVTFSGGSMTGQNLTLPSANSNAEVQTLYSSCGSNCSSYAIDLTVTESNKLPVSVQLTSGPNLLNPVDLSSSVVSGNSGGQFEYESNIPGGTPNVGDQYNFTVTYSDGSQDTGSTVNGKVVGWNGGSTVTGASDAPSNLQTSGSNPDQPNFSWTDATSSTLSTDLYSFYLSQSTNCNGNCTIWQIPGQNSNSSGFSSSITSLTWGTDPTGGGSTPTGSLSPSNQYSWSIYVQDSNGNQAQASTSYTP